MKIHSLLYYCTKALPYAIKNCVNFYINVYTRLLIMTTLNPHYI